MKLYLKLFVFATLTIAFMQDGYANTFISTENRENTESKFTSCNEKFTSCSFYDGFIFGDENSIHTVVVNFVIVKIKQAVNNHHVIYNKYKTYFHQNILTSNNTSYYKKLFYKLHILQI